MSTSSKSSRRGLSTFALKIIAIITMTIDHIGAVFGEVAGDGLLPNGLYHILRCIGRIAFPIFCYILVEGFFYTKSVQKYIIRLLAFSVISQIPYTLAIHKQFLTLQNLNIFFTLSLGMTMLYAIDFSIRKLCQSEGNNQIWLLPGIISAILTFYISGNYGVDYGTYGILLILVFYFFRENETYLQDAKKHLLNVILQFFCIFVITLFMRDAIQIYCVFALIPIFFHNHKRGMGLKYFFYLYYPLHLLILYGIFLLCPAAV